MKIGEHRISTEEQIWRDCVVADLKMLQGKQQFLHRNMFFMALLNMAFVAMTAIYVFKHN